MVLQNDGFKGGDVMEGNLLFGWVRETGDHAAFNSWDRQSWYWKNAKGDFSCVSEVQRIHRNLFLNKDFQYGSSNSDWTVDHDDASSYYYDTENVHVWVSLI